MATMKAIFLWCDGCGDQFSTATIPPYMTVADARTAAHRRGWRHDKINRDWCPSCYRRPTTPPALPHPRNGHA
jgi:hypothetical protein